MSLTVKLIVSLVIAAAVATAATFLQGGQFPDLPTLVTCCVAALVSVTAVSLLDRPAESAQGAGGVKPSTGSGGQTSSDREYGKVKWFNASKGFGFIIKDDGDEIFVHFRSIRGEGRRGLRDGQRVSFVVVDSQKGPQAEDVAGEA